MNEHQEAPQGASNGITATIVPEARRMAFLPNLFGTRAMLVGEGAVFSWAKTLSVDYARQGGAFWDFYTTSNGSGFMVPDGLPKQVTVCNHGNYYEGTMTPEAFGITCTLLGFAAALECSPVRPLRDRMDLLTDFAASHAESAAILRAID